MAGSLWPASASTYGNGIDTWSSLRIPWDANSEPNWKDYRAPYSLSEHAEGIGTTGWDWQAQCSRSLGYDFDLLTSDHADGIAAEELARVEAAAMLQPYIEARRSTGGGGLHLRVYMDAAGIATANHTIHAALAKIILRRMSADCHFDFAEKIDCLGGVLWIWHRRATSENHGFELIKPATEYITEAGLPAG